MLTDTQIVVIQLNLVLAAICAVAAPIAAYASRRELRTVHFNLRMMVNVAFAVYVLFPFMNLAFIAETLRQGTMDFLTMGTFGLVIKNCIVSSVHFMRITNLALCSERFFATVYSQKYERSCRYYFLAPIITLTVLALTCAIGTLTTFFPTWTSLAIVYSLAATFDVSSVLLLFSLHYVNRKSRKRIMEQNLSQKYQTVENIRTLGLLAGHVVILVCIDVCSVIVFFFAYTLVRGPSLFLYVSVVNFSIIAVAVYWISRTDLCMRWCPRLPTRTEPTVTNTAAAVVTVRTALGKKVRVNQTVDEHFQALKNAWR